MRIKSRAIINSLFFLLGALISYILCQFSYLTIDPEVNVIETFVAAFSIVIGIYIAVTIQKRYNQNQNLYNYLVNRLDSLWSDFNSFNDQILLTDKIELTRVSKFIKDFQRKNGEFTKLLLPLNSITNNLEKLSDSLSETFEKCPLKNNIYYFDPQKEKIKELSESITGNFIEIFSDLNKKA